MPGKSEELMLFPKPQSFDRDSPYRYCRFKKKNGQRCGEVFKKWRGSSTICPDCWRERDKEKKAAKIDRRKRPAPYLKPKKEFWNKRKKKEQAEEVGNCCEVCGMAEKDCTAKFGCGLTRDHILPVRFITGNGLGDPHLDLNIKMTCSECGGKKTAAEVKLFNGDVLGFVRDLKKWGWNMEELEMVLCFYRFWSQTLQEHFR